MKYLKCPLLLAAPYSLVLFNVLFFRRGGLTEIVVFLVLVPVLFYLFFRNVKSALVFLLPCLNMAIAFLLASYLNTRLYYENVSSDGMTPVVGMAVAFWGLIFIALGTIALAIKKAGINRREKMNALDGNDNSSNENTPER
jgi:hypothetical protein